MEKAVVAGFVKAAWQDMLNEAALEFFAVKPHAASLAIALVLDADMYVCGVHGFDARVAKRNTKHLTAEIVEHGLGKAKGHVSIINFWYTQRVQVFSVRRANHELNARGGHAFGFNQKLRATLATAYNG